MPLKTEKRILADFGTTAVSQKRNMPSEDRSDGIVAPYQSVP
ncbi:TPA: hypothetical protein ACFOL8_001360 [Neisseria meningitidis]|jgi:hypothetical protein|uniref:Uncharacterized protein n=5 Tax=Neisseria meningitidis TaxID=487 RepID=E6MYF2_NEIMH|nr:MULTISPECIES: hypothetical protein [Neisseria]AJC62964.1 hypothetical protein N875_04675 [Neisseria meningitidis LNP21362]CBA05637.1 hypothetical protein predicted by Glimmer/Critica [Neisseria meningitidis alpha153]CCA45400.1 hypothetical protein NMALPHA522_1859 [Neisseria meningitidis alpha522]AHW75040.1 hypothetical protein NMA510612_0737 [Neisseria meningitidis]EFM03837.1 hypothetical protein HMPREF0602_1671 [Neisseria meningitidis ATCC 13091]